MSSHTKRSVLSVENFRGVLTSPKSSEEARVAAISTLWHCFYDKGSAFFNASQAVQTAYFEVLRDVALNEDVDGETRTNALSALRTGAKKFTHVEPMLREAFGKLPKVTLKGDASLLVEAAVRNFSIIEWEAYGRPETTIKTAKTAQAAKAQAA